MRTAQLAHHSFNGNGGNDHMNLKTKSNPFHKEMDKVFNSFAKSLFTPSPFKSALSSKLLNPLQIDVADNADSIQVVAECPGMEQSDLDVSWADNALTIKGEKKSCWNQESTKLYRMERTFGKFERKIPLHVEIEADKVEASYKNGVLTVTLPKSQEAKNQVKKISIASE